MKKHRFSEIKNIKIEIEVFCISKKCCPTRQIIGAKTFMININESWKPMFGNNIRNMLIVNEGNGCCYTPSIEYFKEVECPHCNTKGNLFFKL